MDKQALRISTVIIIIASLFLIKSNIRFLKQEFATIYPAMFLILGVGFLWLMIRVKFKISRWAWILFILSILFQAIFMPHIHLFTPDDYWIMDQAKNTILKGSSEVCEYNVNGEENCTLMKSSGYPTLLSASFITFGLNNYVAIWLSVLFSSSLILASYLFARNYFRDEKNALIFCILILLSNLYVRLTSHVENIPIALAFVAISMTSLISYHKTNKLDYSLLASISFIISIFIRVEFVLFVIPIIIIFIKNYKSEKDILFPSTLITIFLTLFLAQISRISSISYNSSFSFENLIGNLSSLKIGSYEITIILLAILGTWYFKKKSLPMIYGFIITTIFYFTWAQTNIARVMLTPVVMILFLAAGGLRYLFKENKKILYIFLFILISFFVYKHIDMYQDINNDTVRKFNTKVLGQLDLKDDCYVIVERPVFITATNDIKAIGTMNALSNIAALHNLEKNACLLFYENNYCYEKIDKGPGRSEFQMDSPSRCKYIKNNFELDLIKTFNGYGLEYHLYQVYT